MSDIIIYKKLYLPQTTAGMQEVEQRREQLPSTQRAQRKAKGEHINCTHNLKMPVFCFKFIMFFSVNSVPSVAIRRNRLCCNACCLKGHARRHFTTHTPQHLGHSTFTGKLLHHLLHLFKLF